MKPHLPWAYEFASHPQDSALQVRAFLSKVRGRSLINIHDGGGEQLAEANR
jgi:hypothetical protein